MNLLRTMTVGTAFGLSIFAGAGCDPSTSTAPEPVAQSQAQALTGFDFANGDIASDYVIPLVVPTVRQGITGGDATIILYTTTTTVMSWFDAISPYSATMQGVFSRIPRRPASEGVDNTNRNIAILYASLRALSAVQPKYVATWRQMLVTVGLNPDDNSTNLATAVGIGNFAGNAVVAGRKNDGMNRDGDAGGRRYNLTPYADTTGYEPVNTAFELKDPSRWQPKVLNSNVGIFRIQKYVTPQWGNTRPITMSRREMKRHMPPPPTKSDWRRNPAAYKQQVDELLAASANMTDMQKMIAEHFNDKFVSLGRAGDFIRRQRGMSLEQFVQYDFLLQIATHDGGVATWAAKTKYDAVRPFSAVRFLYGKKKIRAWGGVGKGTVNDITGDEWESYLPTADHPEYPSGSSCFCAAHAQASRRFLGTDTFGWTVPKAAGSSVIEPGITPKTDIVMSFPTFSSFQLDSGYSRLWGGVHFKSAIDESQGLCEPFGDSAYEFVMKHITGNVGPLQDPNADDDDDDDDHDHGHGGHGGGHGHGHGHD